MSEVTQTIDGIPFRLRKTYDFSFLARYGTVFTVFDGQDSGNICFGVKNDHGRYFVKYAGAPTLRATCTPETAVKNLKTALPVYRDLYHENLIRLLNDEPIGGGHAALFEWSDGVCMGRMYPDAHRRFMETPIGVRMQVFNEILRFHAHIHKKGYVAIDFYDGSILYDFTEKKTMLCDIDFYAKKPYRNEMGRLWGSSRFMSPEEFVLDAEIDELTNVYTMGATAFALFSNCMRTREEWPLSDTLFCVATRAVNDDRNQRYPSVQHLMAAWDTAM